jgi:hypothetical protein
MCETGGLEVSLQKQLHINKDVGFRWLGLSTIDAQGYRQVPRSNRLAAGAPITNFASVRSWIARLLLKIREPKASENLPLHTWD